MRRATTYYSTLLAALAAFLMFPAQGRAQFPRTVLIEEFTSVTCKPCTTATPIINTILKAKVGRLLSVRYHLNFPSKGDPWFAANTGDNTARQTYYGATSLPYGRLDGATTVSVTQSGEVQDKVEERLNVESPIKMEVTQTRTGDQFNVSVVLTAGDQGLDGNYKLHVVAVESHIHDDAYQVEPFNKETEFYDVMRKMVPTPDGADVSLAPNEKKTLTYTYTMGSGWQGDEMYTVAFVQNDVSQQIVQTGNSPKPVSGVSTDPTAAAGYSLEPGFPNPVSGATTIRYSLGAPQHVMVDLYTIAGEKVKSFDEGMATVGAHSLVADMSSLPAGVYTYAITAGSFHTSRMITVVR